MAKEYVIFTHGTYRGEHLGFYRKLCRSRIRIAVDGGIRFFLKAGLAPDVLMGDLDSTGRVSKRVRDRVRIVTFPQRKDKTDLHLAIEYCLKQKARTIDVVIPSLGQPDHFLANIMLANVLLRWSRERPRPRLRFISREYEISLLSDQSATFQGNAGDIVSVVPLSKHIDLSCRGTEYDVRDARIRLGDTRGLRNRVVSRDVSLTVKGTALVFHLRKK